MCVFDVFLPLSKTFVTTRVQELAAHLICSGGGEGKWGLV